MEKTRISNSIEYLALLLILSYFFIHNIIVVLIGIIFSLYLLNISFIYKSIRSINKAITKIKVAKNHSKDYKIIDSNSNQIELNKKAPRLTLVEAIEELGFIPSLNQNNDENTA